MLKFMQNIFGGQPSLQLKKSDQLHGQIDHGPKRIAGVIRSYGLTDFDRMRKVGEIVAKCTEHLKPLAKPGKSTLQIDTIAREFIESMGGKPALLNYRGFRHSITVAVNDVVTNGVPNERPLREGDILSLGVSVEFEGMHANQTVTLSVGDIRKGTKRFIEILEECLASGLREIKSGNHIGDYGAAVQSTAESAKCSVIRDYCGYGTGVLLHDEPNIVNYGRRGEGPEIKEGMVMVLMPMIALGRPHIKIRSDGFTAVTKDGSLSATISHTIGVTPTGYEIFTSL
jgi:methionyl aminopeptidase